MKRLLAMALLTLCMAGCGGSTSYSTMDFFAEAFTFEMNMEDDMLMFEESTTLTAKGQQVVPKQLLCTTLKNVSVSIKLYRQETAWEALPYDVDATAINNDDIWKQAIETTVQTMTDAAKPTLQELTIDSQESVLIATPATEESGEQFCLMIRSPDHASFAYIRFLNPDTKQDESLRETIRHIQDTFHWVN